VPIVGEELVGIGRGWGMWVRMTTGMLRSGAYKPASGGWVIGVSKSWTALVACNKERERNRLVDDGVLLIWREEV
jgi:hypothetical protein